MTRAAEKEGENVEQEAAAQLVALATELCDNVRKGLLRTETAASALVAGVQLYADSTKA